MKTFNEWTRDYHEHGIEWLAHQVEVANIAFENAKELEINKTNSFCNQGSKWDWNNKGAGGSSWEH